MYNRNSSVSLTASGSSGVTGRASSVNHLSNVLTSADTTTTYLHSDHVGSGRMTSSVNGYPTWQAVYLPFGDEYTNQLTTNSFKFATYQHDGESDLDYAKFRYYSSQFGRFLSPDLLAGDISNPQSLNRYAYVLNNPLNLVDPLGLQDSDTREDKRNARSPGSFSLRYARAFGIVHS